MAKKEPVNWITVNGKHVPIFEGESKQDAYNRAIAKENESKKSEDIKRNKAQADRLNGKVKPTPIEESIYHNNPNEYGGRGMRPAEQAKIFEQKLDATKEQLKALRHYAYGSYNKVGKEQFAKDNQLEDLIDRNVELHLGGAKLFRGGYVTDEEYNNILNNKQTSMLNGLTSWSLREDVAHMYAQGDNNTGEIFGGRKAENGHRVIFIEDKTDDSLPLPYTAPQSEALRSSRDYTVTKIVKESDYKGKEDDGGRSAKHSNFDKPVTYVYVRSTRRK